MDLLYSYTIVTLMDYCIPNIFEDSEKCSKEDIADWNSSPIYDKVPNEDYKLCKQEVFFFLISNKILLKRKKIHPGTQGVYKGEPNKN